MYGHELMCGFGDCNWAIPAMSAPLEEGVSELRIDYGPGYRVYFVELGPEEVLLLVGGDKRTQEQDIKKAQKLARRIQEDGTKTD